MLCSFSLRTILPLLLFVLFACTLSSNACADKVDEYIKEQMHKQSIPGLALAVVKDGRVVKAKGYGLANIELEVPVRPETVFQIQSVTKQFTATAVMMLVEEGKLVLDDPLSKYLDATPPAWKEVTLRHLLTHTSGIKDFINEPTASLRLEVTEEEILQASAPRPLNFPVGEKYAYSNTNYHLLAMVIRKVTGKFYGDFLQERIFEPLGMKDTAILSLGEIIKNRASGYYWTGKTLRNGQFVAESILGYAGGGIRSTVLDMAKWDAALSGERLLKKASLEQMWTPARLKDGSPTSYGFGWEIGTERERRFVSHGGRHMTGFMAIITRYLEDRLSVIVLSNRSDAPVGRIATQAARQYLPALVPPRPKAVRVPSPVVASYQGNYLSNEGLLYQIHSEKGRLYLNVVGEDEELVPQSETRFYRPETSETLTFVKEPAGKATHLELHQQDRLQSRAARIGPLFSSHALPDPQPERTRQYQQTMSHWTAREALLPQLTPQRRAAWQPQSQYNEWLRENFKGDLHFTFLGDEDVQGRGLKTFGVDVARVLTFQVVSPDITCYIVFYLAQDGKIADFPVYFN